MTDSISVIIPTKNEEKFLPRLLASIRKQTLKPLEIIVADNFSTDRTPDIIRESGALLVEGGLVATGRNKGAKIAKGDILVFFDADDILPKDTFLETAVKLFKDQGLDATTSTIRLDHESRDSFAARCCFFTWNFGLRFSNIFNRSLAGGGPFFICTRQAFEKVKGFTEKMVYGEDVDFANKFMKSGLKFKTLPLNIVTSGRRYKGLIKNIYSITGDLLFGLLMVLKLTHNEKIVSLVRKIYDSPEQA
jgi:glycosyltransferase involved in cell wall biosynthesis